MNTADTLHLMATVIDLNGLHRGNQFAQPGILPRLDICAIAYVIAERLTPDRYPPEFFTDECASLTLIEASAGAMAAIRAISDSLDTTVCETQIEPGTWVPDYIEHVSNWAATPSPVAPKTVPTDAEVIGRILRAINQLALAQGRPGHTDAYGYCLTCGGHGSLITTGEEIPYEELSPRRKQGHDLGHRFYRNTCKPCPDCDGQDRATDAAVSAHEASL